MVARLFATFLLVLCILPWTAPFSISGSTDSLDRHTLVAAIEPLAAPAPVTNPNDDALVPGRSTFLRQSRLTALMVVASDETRSVAAPFARSIVPTALTVDALPLKNVLRL